MDDNFGLFYLLGVRINEEFCIKDCPVNPFFIDSCGYLRRKGRPEQYFPMITENLLRRKYTIIRLKNGKPALNEKYLFVSEVAIAGKLIESGVYEKTNKGDQVDIENFNDGNFYYSVYSARAVRTNNYIKQHIKVDEGERLHYGIKEDK